MSKPPADPVDLDAHRIGANVTTFRGSQAAEHAHASPILADDRLSFVSTDSAGALQSSKLSQQHPSFANVGTPRSGMTGSPASFKRTLSFASSGVGGAISSQSGSGGAMPIGIGLANAHMIPPITRSPSGLNGYLGTQPSQYSPLSTASKPGGSASGAAAPSPRSNVHSGPFVGTPISSIGMLSSSATQQSPSPLTQTHILSETVGGPHDTGLRNDLSIVIPNSLVGSPSTAPMDPTTSQLQPQASLLSQQIARQMTSRGVGAYEQQQQHRSDHRYTQDQHLSIHSSPQSNPASSQTDPSLFSLTSSIGGAGFVPVYAHHDAVTGSGSGGGADDDDRQSISSMSTMTTTRTTPGPPRLSQQTYHQQKQHAMRQSGTTPHSSMAKQITSQKHRITVGFESSLLFHYLQHYISVNHSVFQSNQFKTYQSTLYRLYSKSNRIPTAAYKLPLQVQPFSWAQNTPSLPYRIAPRHDQTIAGQDMPHSISAVQSPAADSHMRLSNHHTHTSTHTHGTGVKSTQHLSSQHHIPPSHQQHHPDQFTALDLFTVANGGDQNNHNGSSTGSSSQQPTPLSVFITTIKQVYVLLQSSALSIADTTASELDDTARQLVRITDCLQQQFSYEYDRFEEWKSSWQQDHEYYHDRHQRQQHRRHNDDDILDNEDLIPRIIRITPPSIHLKAHLSSSTDGSMSIDPQQQQQQLESRKSDLDSSRFLSWCLTLLSQRVHQVLSQPTFTLSMAQTIAAAAHSVGNVNDSSYHHHGQHHDPSRSAFVYDDNRGNGQTTPPHYVDQWGNQFYDFASILSPTRNGIERSSGQNSSSQVSYHEPTVSGKGHVHDALLFLDQLLGRIDLVFVQDIVRLYVNAYLEWQQQQDQQDSVISSSDALQFYLDSSHANTKETEPHHEEDTNAPLSPLQKRMRQHKLEEENKQRLYRVFTTVDTAFLSKTMSDRAILVGSQSMLVDGCEHIRELPADYSILPIIDPDAGISQGDSYIAHETDHDDQHDDKHTPPIGDMHAAPRADGLTPSRPSSVELSVTTDDTLLDSGATKEETKLASVNDITTVQPDVEGRAPMDDGTGHGSRASAPPQLTISTQHELDSDDSLNLSVHGTTASVHPVLARNTIHLNDGCICCSPVPFYPIQTTSHFSLPQHTSLSNQLGATSSPSSPFDTNVQLFGLISLFYSTPCILSPHDIKSSSSLPLSSSSPSPKNGKDSHPSDHPSSSSLNLLIPNHVKNRFDKYIILQHASGYTSFVEKRSIQDIDHQQFHQTYSSLQNIPKISPLIPQTFHPTACPPPQPLVGEIPHTHLLGDVKDNPLFGHGTVLPIECEPYSVVPPHLALNTLTEPRGRSTNDNDCVQLPIHILLSMEQTDSVEHLIKQQHQQEQQQLQQLQMSHPGSTSKAKQGPLQAPGAHHGKDAPIVRYEPDPDDAQLTTPEKPSREKTSGGRGSTQKASTSGGTGKGLQSSSSSSSLMRETSYVTSFPRTSSSVMSSSTPMKQQAKQGGRAKDQLNALQGIFSSPTVTATPHEATDSGRRRLSSQMQLSSMPPPAPTPLEQTVYVLPRKQSVPIITYLHYFFTKHLTSWDTPCGLIVNNLVYSLRLRATQLAPLYAEVICTVRKSSDMQTTHTVKRSVPVIPLSMASANPFNAYTPDHTHLRTTTRLLPGSMLACTQEVDHHPNVLFPTQHCSLRGQSKTSIYDPFSVQLGSSGVLNPSSVLHTQIENEFFTEDQLKHELATLEGIINMIMLLLTTTTFTEISSSKHPILYDTLLQTVKMVIYDSIADILQLMFTACYYQRNQLLIRRCQQLQYGSFWQLEIHPALSGGWSYPFFPPAYYTFNPQRPLTHNLLNQLKTLPRTQQQLLRHVPLSSQYMTMLAITQQWQSQIESQNIHLVITNHVHQQYLRSQYNVVMMTVFQLYYLSMEWIVRWYLLEESLWLAECLEDGTIHPTEDQRVMRFEELRGTWGDALWNVRQLIDCYVLPSLLYDYIQQQQQSTASQKQPENQRTSASSTTLRTIVNSLISTHLSWIHLQITNHLDAQTNERARMTIGRELLLSSPEQDPLPPTPTVSKNNELSQEWDNPSTNTCRVTPPSLYTTQPNVSHYVVPIIAAFCDSHHQYYHSPSYPYYHAFKTRQQQAYTQHLRVFLEQQQQLSSSYPAEDSHHMSFQHHHNPNNTPTFHLLNPLMGSPVLNAYAISAVPRMGAYHLVTSQLLHKLSSLIHPSTATGHPSHDTEYSSQPMNANLFLSQYNILDDMNTYSLTDTLLTSPMHSPVSTDTMTREADSSSSHTMHLQSMNYVHSTTDPSCLVTHLRILCQQPSPQALAFFTAYRQYLSQETTTLSHMNMSHHTPPRIENGVAAVLPFQNGIQPYSSSTIPNPLPFSSEVSPSQLDATYQSILRLHDATNTRRIACIVSPEQYQLIDQFVHTHKLFDQPTASVTSSSLQTIYPDDQSQQQQQQQQSTSNISSVVIYAALFDEITSHQQYSNRSNGNGSHHWGHHSQHTTPSTHGASLPSQSTSIYARLAVFRPLLPSVLPHLVTECVLAHRNPITLFQLFSIQQDLQATFRQQIDLANDINRQAMPQQSPSPEKESRLTSPKSLHKRDQTQSISMPTRNKNTGAGAPLSSLERQGAVASSLLSVSSGGSQLSKLSASGGGGGADTRRFRSSLPSTAASSLSPLPFMGSAATPAPRKSNRLRQAASITSGITVSSYNTLATSTAGGITTHNPTTDDANLAHGKQPHTFNDNSTLFHVADDDQDSHVSSLPHSKQPMHQSSSVAVPSATPSNLPFYDAIMKLRQLPSIIPLDAKLTHLCRVLHSIVSSVERQQQQQQQHRQRQSRHQQGSQSADQQQQISISTDDVLNVLVYVIIQAQVPNFLSILQMLSSLTDESAMLGENGYVLTSMMSACMYLESITMANALSNVTDENPPDPSKRHLRMKLPMSLQDAIQHALDIEGNGAGDTTSHRLRYLAIRPPLYPGLGDTTSKINDDNGIEQHQKDNHDDSHNRVEHKDDRRSRGSGESGSPLLIDSHVARIHPLQNQDLDTCNPVTLMDIQFKRRKLPPHNTTSLSCRYFDWTDSKSEKTMDLLSLTANLQLDKHTPNSTDEDLTQTGIPTTALLAPFLDTATKRTSTGDQIGENGHSSDHNDNDSDNDDDADDDDQSVHVADLLNLSQISHHSPRSSPQHDHGCERCLYFLQKQCHRMLCHTGVFLYDLYQVSTDTDADCDDDSDDDTEGSDIGYGDNSGEYGGSNTDHGNHSDQENDEARIMPSDEHDTPASPRFGEDHLHTKQSASLTTNALGHADSVADQRPLILYLQKIRDKSIHRAQAYARSLDIIANTTLSSALRSSIPKDHRTTAFPNTLPSLPKATFALKEGQTLPSLEEFSILNTSQHSQHGSPHEDLKAKPADTPKLPLFPQYIKTYQGTVSSDTTTTGLGDHTSPHDPASLQSASEHNTSDGGMVHVSASVTQFPLHPLFMYLILADIEKRPKLDSSCVMVEYHHTVQPSSLSIPNSASPSGSDEYHHLRSEHRDQATKFQLSTLHWAVKHWMNRSNRHSTLLSTGGHLCDGSLLVINTSVEIDHINLIMKQIAHNHKSTLLHPLSPSAHSLFALSDSSGVSVNQKDHQHRRISTDTPREKGDESTTSSPNAYTQQITIHPQSHSHPIAIPVECFIITPMLSPQSLRWTSSIAVADNGGSGKESESHGNANGSANTRGASSPFVDEPSLWCQVTHLSHIDLSPRGGQPWLVQQMVHKKAKMQYFSQIYRFIEHYYMNPSTSSGAQPPGGTRPAAVDTDASAIPKNTKLNQLEAIFQNHFRTSHASSPLDESHRRVSDEGSSLPIVQSCIDLYHQHQVPPVCICNTLS